MTGQTTLNTALHNRIRQSVLQAYSDPFNAGKEPDAFLIEGIVHSVAEALLDNSKADPKMIARAKAFDAIQTERDYQNAGFGNAADRVTGIQVANNKPMTPGEHLLTIDFILRDAKSAWYRPGAGAQSVVTDAMRKMAAVCVGYMEHYGALPRRFSLEQQLILEARARARAGAERPVSDTCDERKC